MSASVREVAAWASWRELEASTSTDFGQLDLRAADGKKDGAKGAPQEAAMTDVNRYRDGEMSSTTLMQRAMEEAHAVPQGEGKDVKWRADHESMEGMQRRLHDEPAKAAEWGAALVGGLETGALLKTGIKNLAKVIAHPIDSVVEEGLSQAKWMAGVASVEVSTYAVAGLGAVAAAAEWVNASVRADQLTRLSDVDAMDVAVTSILDLDVGFKQADIAKHPGIVPASTLAYFDSTRFGREHKPELQAAADAGSHAALDALRCGGRTEYFRLHPENARRLENDIAFNKGFEAVMWSASQSDGEARLEATKKALSERDVRLVTSRPVQG